MAGNKSESGRAYGGEAPGARAARRREQLLNAGTELFGTIGYRATTVRLLCRKAKVTDRYFYESFTNTEDLLVAVYQRCMDGTYSKVVGAVSEQAGGDVGAMITAGLNAFFEAVEDPRVARICWLEVLGVSPRVDQTYNQAVRNFADLLLLLGRVTYPTSAIDDEEGAVLAVAVIGGVSQSALGWLLSDYAATRQTMVAATSRLLLGASLAIQAELNDGIQG